MDNKIQETIYEIKEKLDYLSKMDRYFFVLGAPAHKYKKLPPLSLE